MQLTKRTQSAVTSLENAARKHLLGGDCDGWRTLDECPRWQAAVKRLLRAAATTEEER